MQHIKTRSSAAPANIKCPASIYYAQNTETVEAGQPAQLGTIIHDQIEVELRGTGSKREPQTTEERILFANFRNVWDQVRDLFTEADYTSIEERMTVARDANCEGYAWQATSKPDLIGRTESDAFVLDWKTGRVERDYWPQLMEGLCLYEDHLGVDFDRATLILADLRHNQIEIKHVARPDIARHRRQMALNVETAAFRGHQPDSHHTGPHCEHCPVAHVCQIQQERTRLLIDRRTDAESYAKALTPAGLIRSYQDLKVAERMLKQIRDAIKATVMAKGEVSDGKQRLTIASKTRRSFEATPKSLSMLVNNVSSDRVKDCLSISVSKAEDAFARSHKAQTGGTIKEGKEAFNELFKESLNEKTYKEIKQERVNDE